MHSTLTEILHHAASAPPRPSGHADPTSSSATFVAGGCALLLALWGMGYAAIKSRRRG